MKTQIYFFLSFLPSILFAQSAEVTCWNNDCLKNGWTWESHSQFVEYGCYRDGCDISGWIANNPNKIYTQCKDKGCFTEGWYQIDQQTQTLQREIVCRELNNEKSCFKHGWTAYSRDQGQIFTVLCWDRDCYNRGWTVQFIDGQIIRVACKSGGCYKSGWKEF